jgi:hypothetical protein
VNYITREAVTILTNDRHAWTFPQLTAHWQRYDMTAPQNELCGPSSALSHIVSREADGKDAPDSR